MTYQLHLPVSDGSLAQPDAPDLEIHAQPNEIDPIAAELIKLNLALVAQNAEKELRAAELVIANEELVFQNLEKEKRAKELLVANEELRKAKQEIQRINEDLEQKVRKRTKELELVNKDLESFSYSVSHDLRAPLRAINGYARILEEDYGLQIDEEGKRLLGIVQANATKMGMLIDDLLEFSRLGAKKIQRSWVNMQQLVESVTAELTAAGSSNVVITINALLPAFADKPTIKQVWINIIGNALKYSSNTKNPCIRINSERLGSDTIYSVSDNGVGFDMQYAGKLFGVFQRLHAASDFEGTGVGLALVQRIIIKHYGKVWARAKVDEGAVFYFSLPDNEK
jgi:light-regulated signal transduction histidine kinase (bacteriophytochrome)